eukprot:6469433-Amphidinium_carterae.3
MAKWLFCDWCSQEEIANAIASVCECVDHSVLCLCWFLWEHGEWVVEWREESKRCEGDSDNGDVVEWWTVKCDEV